MDITIQITNGASPVVVHVEDPLISILQFLIPVIVAGVTAYFLWYQIRKQTKVDSARFTMEFLQRTGEKYRETLDLIKDKSEQQSKVTYDNKKIRLMLNHFEYMAGLEQDGLIKIKHIDEVFGQALLRINQDGEIKEIMEDARKNDKTIYSNIISLMDKIKKRH